MGKALTFLKSLTENMQERVMTYLEHERVFFVNSRSKSGFLYAACDKARHGSLDARGVGLPDPWRSYLLHVATPKRCLIDLKPADSWLQKSGDVPFKIVVDVSADPGLGVPSVALSVS